MRRERLPQGLSLSPVKHFIVHFIAPLIGPLSRIPLIDWLIERSWRGIAWDFRLMSLAMVKKQNPIKPFD